MSESIAVEAPGGFAPLTAVGWADPAGACQPASSDAPLPVSPIRPQATPVLAGTRGVAGLVGPFVPALDRPVYLTLSGSWQGSVRLCRTGAGQSQPHALTLAGQDWGRFTGNACEAVWQESEAGARLWLDCAPTSGQLTYRLAQ